MTMRRTVTETDDAEAAVDGERTVRRVTTTVSAAQIIGLIVGIGYTTLGIAAVVRTGFDTSHIYTPHLLVWHLAHSPLLGAIEIAFGVLMILASVVDSRSAVAFLGTIAFIFGIVVLTIPTPNRLNHWLAVTHRNGWVLLISGAVVALSALLLPTLGGTRTETHQRAVVENTM